MMDKQEDIIKSFDNERGALIESFDKKNSKLISELLGEIFPALDTGGFVHYGVTDSDAAGRVSAAQRLYIAFHYVTPKGFISDQEIMQFIAGEVERAEFLENVLQDDADERFFEMMTHYSSHCKNYSFDVIQSVYNAFLKSDKLIQSLEDNHGFMSRDLYRQMNWLTNKIISDNDSKFELVKAIVEKVENTPLSTDILYKIRDQFKEDNWDEPWVTTEELQELETIIQDISIEAITDKLFIKNHLESHVFFGLRRSSKEKASELLTSIMQGENGVIRVAEIISNTGSDSSNGPYAEITESSFSDTADLVALREKAKAVEISHQKVCVQATLNSIIDGNKYYLRDGTKGDCW